LSEEDSDINNSVQQWMLTASKFDSSYPIKDLDYYECVIASE